MIPRAKTPEAVGVDSKEVQAFLDDCIRLHRELHSIIVMRHGKIACEIYRAPYAADRVHMMYSISKSFTSTAIGFAIAEGLIALNTRIVDLFPDVRGKKEDPYPEALCVEDLLTMRSGLSVTPFMDKTKDNWFRTILGSPWASKPGTEFFYISENMYLLCCIIHQVTGGNVVDFLMPRLFEPLGIERPFWETDPRGIETGGWGLMLKTMDLAKFTLLYQQNGKWNGKQILPKGWVEQATRFHTRTDNSEQMLDTQAGYGYCFWRSHGYENSYRADGMFSQTGIVFEDWDACLVITAGDANEQAMHDVTWAHFPKAFMDDAPDAETTPLSLPSYRRLPKRLRPATEQKLIGKRIVFSRSLLLNAIGYPVSVAPLPTTFMGKDPAGNITNVRFAPQGDALEMQWTEGSVTNTILIGMDGDYRETRITLGSMPLTILAVGCWNSDVELELMIRPIEAVAARRLVFTFFGNAVRLQPAALPPTSEMGKVLAVQVRSVFKSELIARPLELALPHMGPLVDMPQVGVLV